MAHDLTSQFYSSLNLPLHEKLADLTRMIDLSAPNKELQALFPQLVNNIFANSFTNGWGLRMITLDANKYEFEALTAFLEPQGPMFRLCYKLLSDPQLKYNLPLNLLPGCVEVLESLREGDFGPCEAETEAYVLACRSRYPYAIAFKPPQPDAPHDAPPADN